MKKVESIIDFGGGEIVDRINFEMAKVIENINNPNTDEKPRKLTIEVKLTPKNNRKTIEMQTSEFLFRIMNNGSFALYEADGGAWKKQAKANIKEYYSKAFATEIKKGTIIIVG